MGPSSDLSMFFAQWFFDAAEKDTATPLCENCRKLLSFLGGNMSFWVNPTLNQFLGAYRLYSLETLTVFYLFF